MTSITQQSAEPEPQALELGSVEIGQVIEQAISLVIPEAAKREIHFELTKHLPMPERVLADAGRIQQLVMNMLLGTLRSAGPGLVKVSTRVEALGETTPPQEIVEAPGMETADVVLLVITIEYSGPRAPDGGGFSLSVPLDASVHAAIVHAGSCQLSIFCGMPFDGDDFVHQPEEASFEDTITLPSTRSTGAWLLSGHMDLETLAARSAAAHDRPLTVLVADDYEVNRMLQTAQLEQLGYRADAVTNGEEVLRALHARDYDVVMLDIRMPVMDGLEAARRILVRDDRARPFIVAVTAAAGPGDRERIRAAGIDACLVKPLAMADLADVLMLAYAHRTGEVSIPDSQESAVGVELNLDTLSIQLGAAADELLRRVIPVYLRELPGRRAALSDAIDGADAVAVARVCHGLKGSSRSVGASELAAVCETLEQRAYVGDIPSKNELVGVLDLAGRTGIALRRKLSALGS